jgi:PAS domain S-box-containing protein/diguanylate cyclase (GGDEF)-like protein
VRTGRQQRELPAPRTPARVPARRRVPARPDRTAARVAVRTAVLVALLVAVPAVAGPLAEDLTPTTAALIAGGAAVLLVAVQLATVHRGRRLARALETSQAAFRTLVKSSVDPVVILDRELRVSFCSQSAADLLGLQAAGLSGRALAPAVHPDDAPALLAALGGPPHPDVAVRTARIRHADGQWRLIQATVRDLRDDPDVGAVVLYCRDVPSSAPAPGLDPELHELSLTDPGTGLPNRAALVRRIGEVQRTAAARPSALALVGLSGLDADELGPAARATALRAVTARLTRELRGEDWLARGKDTDFAVLVTGSVADAEIVAARLVAAVGPLSTAEGTLALTASAGVTALGADLDPGEALRRGDLALRSARAAGPCAVHRYDDALRSAQDRRSRLRTDLAGALERGQLRLTFQPVVDAVMNRTVSVEALLRWRHPLFGDVSPTEFVPLAEESPLIVDIGRWVLREACGRVAALDDADDLAVAVNVSARQVRSGELVPDVVAALEHSGLPASRLVVELTESVLLDDPHVTEDLAALRQLGVRIAVDDFGTGWSSLAYLVGMPVDVLKMDQLFLADVEHDPARQAMCRAVLSIGSTLGLPVVVEGVTTPAVLAVLRDMGHRYLQGFLFSRPLEADQLAAGAWRAAALAAAASS